MTQVTDTIVFDLPPAVDAAGAVALIADMIKLPQANEINLNAAAVSSVSLGYLQILVSAFKTFPNLTVSAASAEFAEAFGGYGIDYPFAVQAAGGYGRAAGQRSRACRDRAGRGRSRAAGSSRAPGSAYRRCRGRASARAGCRAGSRSGAESGAGRGARCGGSSRQRPAGKRRAPAEPF